MHHTSRRRKKPKKTYKRVAENQVPEEQTKGVDHVQTIVSTCVVPEEVK